MKHKNNFCVRIVSRCYRKFSSLQAEETNFVVLMPLHRKEFASKAKKNWHSAIQAEFINFLLEKKISYIQLNSVESLNSCLKELEEKNGILKLFVENEPSYFETQFHSGLKKLHNVVVENSHTLFEFKKLQKYTQEQFTPWYKAVILENNVEFENGIEKLACRSAELRVEHFFKGSNAPCRTYKVTRNNLSGEDSFSRFSPWLAFGGISAKELYLVSLQHDAEHGENEGTKTFRYELFWREFFYHKAFSMGAHFFGKQMLPDDNSQTFKRWCARNTGIDLIDAGLNELFETGFVSNRMRQILASFFVYQLKLPWQWGAQCFEDSLIDFDAASNWGNWRYISGEKFDPRKGRIFDVQKQGSLYDPQKEYRKKWLS